MSSSVPLGRLLVTADRVTAYRTLGYAIALCEARSCLIALASRAQTFEESIHFEHLLLALDSMHNGYPRCHP